MLINKNSKGTRAAYGGVLSALCVVLLYLSAVFTFVDAIFWIIASIVIGVCIKELNIKIAAGVYVSSAIISFLTVPNIFASIAFAAFFGLIPLLYYLIDLKAAKFKLLALLVLDILYTAVAYLIISRFYIVLFEGVKAPVLILFVFFVIYYPCYNRIFGNIYFLIKRAINPDKY